MPLLISHSIALVNKTFLTVMILWAFSFTTHQGLVEAAEFRSGVEVFIGSNEVLNEDVYVFAGRVIVDGTINGDLIAAGENIEVNGMVNGDLIVAARSITVNGAVEDDIRAAGSELQFLSSIGGDLVTAGDQIRIEPSSMIGEDLVAGANTLIVGGDVEGNLDLSVSDVRITGTVQGNVNATVEGLLTLGPDATIEGELVYTSQNDVMMQSGAEVVGEVTKQAPMVSILGNEFQVSAFILILNNLVSQAKWFISTLLLGLILIWLFPVTTRELITTLLKSPWRSLGVGVLILSVAPILLLVTLILVLSILGFAAFPIAAVPAAFYLSLLLLAKPLVAMLIGGFVAKRIARREDYAPGNALVIGAAILAVVGLIPYVESVVSWLTLFLGFGVWLLYFYRHYRESRLAQRA